MSLAQRVRDYRYAKGWGPDELASKAAISRTALYQIESGKTELPRAGTLRRIALALDVPMENLLGNTEPHEALSFPTVPSEPSMRPRGQISGWYPAEGVTMASRSGTRYDSAELGRFGKEYLPGHDGATLSRERELVNKLHDVLASPFGDAIARIVEESHRLLPSPRIAGGS
ncbi:MAG: hypothetical protein NVSMB9_10950 [Isosphaeraceae bacterium]